MTPLRIDFASPSVRRTLFLVHPALLACTVLGLLLCLSAAVAGYRLVGAQRAHAAQLRQAQERQARQVTRAAPAAPRALVSPAQAAAVNGAVMRLNLPWRELQDAIAAATPRSVALLALEPDARKRVLKITAEARSSDAMITYLHALKQQELFSSVSLTRHEINEQDANQPIRFQIEAQWVAP